MKAIEFAFFAMDLQDALNLLPSSVRDRRAEVFVQILHEELQYPVFLWQQEEDSELIGAIAAFAPRIAPYATRLSVAVQRQLLSELPELIALSGSVYSLKRALELFEYTLVLEENSSESGTYIIKIPQVFTLAEVQAINDTFAPVGRILTEIRSTVAILLDGTRFFDGTTTLAG